MSEKPIRAHEPNAFSADPVNASCGKNLHRVDGWELTPQVEQRRAHDRVGNLALDKPHRFTRLHLHEIHLAAFHVAEEPKLGIVPFNVLEVAHMRSIL